MVKTCLSGNGRTGSAIAKFYHPRAPAAAQPAPAQAGAAQPAAAAAAAAAPLGAAAAPAPAPVQAAAQPAAPRELHPGPNNRTMITSTVDPGASNVAFVLIQYEVFNPDHPEEPFIHEYQVAVTHKTYRDVCWFAELAQ
jgi:hypothetical protein